MKPRAFYLVLVFWIGFVALVYQIYSVRVLFLFFVESTHAVALAVSSFLAGLACASLLFSRVPRARTHALIGGMMLAAAVYGYGVLTHFEWIPLALDAIARAVPITWLAAFLKYAILWVYLFLPAFFLGGAFPLVAALYADTRERQARDTGTVYFWDTLGAIAGALASGFFFLPVLGLHATAAIAAALNLLIAAALIERPILRYMVLACLLLLVATETNHAMSRREAIQLDKRFGNILFQKPSPFGRVTVGKVQGNKLLFIDYRPMCNPPALTERDLARLVLPHVPRHGRTLVIGLGCGYTAAAMAYAPQAPQVDVAEINPVIPEATRLFDAENHHVLDAPNLALHIVDGAQWLRTTPTKYDAIAIDVEHVSIIYSSPLFTREYFAYARDHLANGGMFGLWSLTVSPPFTRVMLNTLKSVFPYVRMRNYAEGSTNFYASMRPFTLPAGKAPQLPGFAAQVAKLDTTELNTLENRALEKYYNLNENIGLPADYHSDFLRPNNPVSY